MNNLFIRESRSYWRREVYSGDGLFLGIEQDTRVMRYHSLITSSPLPDELRVTAWTHHSATFYDSGSNVHTRGTDTAYDIDSSNSVIMSLQHKYRPIYGVQFHPQSIATPCVR